MIAHGPENVFCRGRGNLHPGSAVPPGADLYGLACATRLRSEHRVSSSNGQSTLKDRWCCGPTISSSSVATREFPIGRRSAVLPKADSRRSCREPTHPSPPRPESTRGRAILYSIPLRRHRPWLNIGPSRQSSRDFLRMSLNSFGPLISLRLRSWRSSLVAD